MISYSSHTSLLNCKSTYSITIVAPPRQRGRPTYGEDQFLGEDNVDDPRTGKTNSWERTEKKKMMKTSLLNKNHWPDITPQRPAQTETRLRGRQVMPLKRPSLVEIPPYRHPRRHLERTQDVLRSVKWPIMHQVQPLPRRLAHRRPLQLSSQRQLTAIQEGNHVNPTEIIKKILKAKFGRRQLRDPGVNRYTNFLILHFCCHDVT